MRMGGFSHRIANLINRGGGGRGGGVGGEGGGGLRGYPPLIKDTSNLGPASKLMHEYGLVPAKMVIFDPPRGYPQGGVKMTIF